MEFLRLFLENTKLRMYKNFSSWTNSRKVDTINGISLVKNKRLKKAPIEGSQSYPLRIFQKMIKKREFQT